MILNFLTLRKYHGIEKEHVTILCSHNRVVFNILKEIFFLYVHICSYYENCVSKIVHS